jgi:transcriptional regulator with XRE-family HTH domain
MLEQMRSLRGSLPSSVREALTAARRERGWSQAELGRQVGLPQMHISAIETGRVVPRFDTLLDLVRVLGYDLLLVPRQLVPVVDALVRDEAEARAGIDVDAERPLYLPDEDQESV